MSNILLRCLLPSVSPTLSNALLFTYSPFCYTGHCEIKNVGVHHNELSGFRFDDNAEGFVEGCESYNNKQYGMASSRSSSPTIVNSLFHGAESIGFHFSLKSSGSVKGCEIRNMRDGIFCDDWADPQVFGNSIHDCSVSGVKVGENGQGRFEENMIVGCDQGVVVHMAGSYPFFAKNTMRDSIQSGIHMEHASGGIFDNNEVFNNGLNGFTVENSACPVAKNNKIYNNKGNGLEFKPSSAGAISDNSIHGNGNDGIRMSKTGT